MKKIIYSLLTILIPSIAICQSPDLVIKDVNIISMVDHKVTTKKSIAVSGRIITEITDFNKIKTNNTTQIIDGKNKYMIPGLAEMHSHLPAPEKIDTYLIANVAAGVTRLRAMNSESPVLEMRDLIRTKTISPKIYYPFIISKEDSVASETDMMVMVKTAAASDHDFIKLFSIANETQFNWLMNSAAMFNIKVCGHYPSPVKPEAVLKSGFKSIEHLGGYTKIKDSTQLADLIELTRTGQVYNCPTLDWDYVAADLMLFDDYKKRLVFENAPKHFLDQWEKELASYESKEGRNKILRGRENYLPVFNYKMKILKKLNENGNLLLLGSDPGGSFQMHGFNLYEEMIHWSNAGISNYDILRAGTVNPAKFFGEETQWGTIEVGKAADLILLSKNPLDDIRNMKTGEITIIGGKVYSKKDLLAKI